MSIGLCRVLTDRATIVYLQDILVSPNYQHRGVGRALVERCLAPFTEVRQKVLLTDDRPEQHAFYASLGFGDTREAHDGVLHAFVRFDAS